MEGRKEGKKRETRQEGRKVERREVRKETRKETREREGGKEGIKLRRMQKIEKLKVETTRSRYAMERLEIKSKCGKKAEAK